MQLCDVNPHIRFAATLRQGARRGAVKVTDCRVFYITQGYAEITIGQDRYNLIPHSLFYCRGGSIYDLETEQGVALMCLDFDLDQSHNKEIIAYAPCGDLDKWDSLPVYFEPVVDSAFLNDHLYLTGAGDLQGQIEKILQEYSSGAPYARQMAGGLLKQLLTRLHRAEQTSMPDKVALVQTYIQDHYAEDITNQRLAELAGYHAYYLNRIFTASTGSSLHNYLINVRMNRASYLLLNTDLELQDIGEQVGFRSYPHFSSYFKQTYGYSPKEYRKRLNGNV